MRYAVIDVAIIKHYCNRTHADNKGSYNANSVVLEGMSVICYSASSIYAYCIILTNGTVNMYYYSSKQRAWPCDQHIFTLFAAHVNIASSMILFCAMLVAAQLIPVYCIALSNS